MLLGLFKTYIENFPEKTMFEYGISSPFSWRGIYREVAFSIQEDSMSREEILSKIQEAYEKTFHGYKGGKYEYGDYTQVHFERDGSSFSDGEYCAKMIAKIEGNEIFQSPEMRLVKSVFSQDHTH